MPKQQLLQNISLTHSKNKTMKKIGLTLLVALCGTYCLAQQNKLSYGLKAGINISTIHDGDPKSKTGFVGGAFANYKINFSNIKDNKYKEIAKRYVRFRLTKFKHSTCVYDVRVATHFFNYLSDNLISLQKLHRKDVETYLAVLQEEDIYKKDFMISLRGMLRHAQITDAPLALISVNAACPGVSINVIVSPLCFT